MNDSRSSRNSAARASWLVLTLLSLLTVAAPAQAAADSSETVNLTRPITYIVAFGPGGGSDQVARASAHVLSEELGVKLPVVNMPGGTGNVGLNKLVSSRPGGAMAILIQDTLATVPLGTSSFQLDQIQAVCRLQSMPSALLVKTGTYENWKALKAAAESGAVKVATVGRNSIDSLMLAVLGESQGVGFRNVPFSDPGQRYIALLGGAVDALYEQLGDVQQYIESGQFKPVVIFSKKPVKGFEDVTHATKLDVPADAILTQFRGIVMPAATDPAEIHAISTACRATTTDPKFQKFQAKVLATEDSYMPADEFEAYIKQQAQVIGRLMKMYFTQE